MSPAADPDLLVLRAIGAADQEGAAATEEWIEARTGISGVELGEAMDRVERDGSIFASQLVRSAQWRGAQLLGHAQLLIPGRERLRAASPPNDPLVVWLVERDMAVLRALDDHRALRDFPYADGMAAVTGMTPLAVEVALDVLDRAGLIVGHFARSPFCLGAQATAGAQLTSAGYRALRDHSPAGTRHVLTLSFTDVVDSTGHIDRLGPEGWLLIVSKYKTLVVEALSRFEGVLVDPPEGGGVFCTFESPSSAISFGLNVATGVRDLAIEVRTGIHTAECLLVGHHPIGLGVTIARRVEGAAGAGEVWATETVRSLLEPGRWNFEYQDERQLKGVAEPLRLYRVTAQDGTDRPSP